MAKSQTAKTKTKQAQQVNLLNYYLILGIIAFAVYVNSLSGEFVFDDETVVLSDPTITSLSNIPKYFTGELGFSKVIGAYYRPMVSSSYAIDYALWGLKPFGFHLTNVIIHIICTLLIFRLLLLIFEKSQSTFKYYAVMLGAVIFAVHPIHTEAAAWVSGRTDSLACLFFFAAFIYYLKYSDNTKPLYFVLTLVFYLLALFSKEMAITLPVVITLYDLVVNKFSIKDLIAKKSKIYIALFLLSLIYLVLRWYALKDIPARGTYFYFYDKDTATAIYTMLQTIPIYFRLAVVPYGMLYHYSGYLRYLSSPTEPAVLVAAGFLLVIAFAIYYFYKRLPLAAYSLLFFFITLLPVLNIVPTMNFMADRFLYIPSAFLSIFFIALVLKYYSPKNANIIYTVSAVIIVSFTVMTIMRNADWKTNDSLFLSAEGKPGTVLYVNLGNIFAKRGEYEVAADYYRKALALRDESLMANNNLGKVYMVKGNFDSAYYFIHKAFLLDTLSPEPMHALAQLYARSNKMTESVLWLEKVQTVAPNYMNSAQLLMELKSQMQNTLDSAGKTNPALQLEQSSYNHYQSKNYEQAITELKQLIKINPQNTANYYNNIGMCYLDQSKYNEAIENFNLSVENNPNFSTAFNNLGQCYEKTGDKQKAKESYLRAFEVDPTNLTAKQNFERLK